MRGFHVLLGEFTDRSFKSCEIAVINCAMANDLARQGANDPATRFLGGRPPRDSAHTYNQDAKQSCKGGLALCTWFDNASSSSISFM